MTPLPAIPCDCEHCRIREMAYRVMWDYIRDHYEPHPDLPDFGIKLA